MWCSKCGVSVDKARLLDVISPKGIIRVCEACFKDEDMPIVRKPTIFQLKEAEKKPRFLDRFPVKEQKKEENKKTETTLKEIVDRNFEETVSKERKPRPDLVNNFHWIVMRSRRLKKLTQEQLAKELDEPAAAIKMAEQGILPGNDYRLANKLENFLGIKIVKEGVQRIPQEQPMKVIKFDPQNIQNLTIADLKRMREKKEAKILGDEEKSEEEFLEEDKERKEDTLNL